MELAGLEVALGEFMNEWEDLGHYSRLYKLYSPALAQTCE